MASSITIFGTWEKLKAEKARTYAERIGKLAAQKNLEIISGGGEGISKIVIDAYRQYKGKKYTALFPSKEYMDKVGENEGPEPDSRITLPCDYPHRNICMIRDYSKFIVALHGGLGTLAEIILAVKDYKKPVAVVDFGELAEWVKAILPIRNKIILTDDIECIIHLATIEDMNRSFKDYNKEN